MFTWKSHRSLHSIRTGSFCESDNCAELAAFDDDDGWVTAKNVKNTRSRLAMTHKKYARSGEKKRKRTEKFPVNRLQPKTSATGAPECVDCRERNIRMLAGAYRLPVGPAYRYANRPPPRYRLTTLTAMLSNVRNHHRGYHVTNPYHRWRWVIRPDGTVSVSSSTDRSRALYE